MTGSGIIGAWAITAVGAADGATTAAGVGFNIATGRTPTAPDGAARTPTAPDGAGREPVAPDGGGRPDAGASLDFAGGLNFGGAKFVAGDSRAEEPRIGVADAALAARFSAFSLAFSSAA